MEIEQTALWADIRKIMSDGAKSVRFEYTALIHTAKEEFKAYQILSIDTVRDYANNIGDAITLEFTLPLGDYTKLFYPNRSNLEITISRVELVELGDKKAANKSTEQERYKAIFLPEENPHTEASDLGSLDQQSLNLMDLRTVKVQLLNRSLEAIRIKTTGNVFKNTTNESVIHAVLMDETNKIQIDGKPAADGLDIIPADNQEVKRHIVIPQGTLVTGVPTYCQELMNGVYTAGIGTYFQTYNEKRLWFVYPLFNTTRFKQNVNKMVFYSVPRHRFPNIERTFRKEGGVTYVLSTSTKKYKDHAETEYMNTGVGFRMTDARSIMKKPVEMGVDGPVGKRSNLNTEVSIKSRADDLNYAPIAENSISSNPFAQYSRIAQSNGGRIDMVWENADPSLIYPGMPCKYVFLQGTEIKEQHGVVLFCHALVQLEGKGISQRAHRTSCMLTLFVEPLETPV